MTAIAHATAPTRPGIPEPHPYGLPRPGRTLVMGVVNVTPDSFSDGGQSGTPGCPLLVGTSRTSFLGRVLQDPAQVSLR
ncbi:hypothetical protein ACLB9X_03225 [Streptomyces sp. 5K101]|uniref:hypothetical protein n=1 Tax=Streptomyces sp. 5K101 TaxID=3390037 RepID=UPI003974AE5F